MVTGSISRREFLKILGYGSVGMALTPLVKFFQLGKIDQFLVTQTYAQSAGSWVLGPNTSVVAIHAALMPSGKMFYLAGSGFHAETQNGPYEARILDINTGAEKTLQQSEDLFCVGLAGLPDGNVLLAGGTLLYDTNVNNCNGFWHGLNAAYEVDGPSESLNKVSSMAHGRWYPTCLTLQDGKVLVVNGYDEFGVNNLLAEIYDPVSKSWSIKFDPNTSATYCVGFQQDIFCPGSGSPCYGGPSSGVAPNLDLYPRMHLMPSGLVIVCGPLVTVRSWDPSTGVWSTITQTSSYRQYGASFLLPLNNTLTERGKILIVGGDPTPATPSSLKTAEILDFNAGTSTNPVLRSAPSMKRARKFTLPVILPNGKCVIFGGFDNATGTTVNTPEMFDPISETWSDLPTASVGRGYHSIAVLLPDGRVWTAGNQEKSPPPVVQELRTEIFSPGYFFVTRPTISGPPVVGAYGGTIAIPTPNGSTIDAVSLVRLGAVTHHYEPNARLLWLQIVGKNPNLVTVSAPLNSRLAPPGYYMLHVLSAGVPSVSKIIQIPGSALPDTTPPAQVNGLNVTIVSNSQLNLSWTANTEPDLNHYNVYRGTTAGFPVTLGTTVPIATPTANSFSNTGLATSTTYYYKVAAVDNVGNIGPLSAERSGTTLSGPDTTIPSVAITSPTTGATVSAGSITVTGTASDNVNVVDVGVKVDESGAYTAATSTSGNYATWTVTLTNVTVGDHRLFARATDGAGNKNWYDILVHVVQSDTTPPAQVNGLNVTIVSNSQLNLSWTANTEPDLNHYNVYRGTTAGFPVTLGTTVPIATPIANSFSNTGLATSTTYYYKVSAVDASGNIGPLSAERSGTTLAGADTTAPSVTISSPTNGSSVSAGSITVTGTASDNVNVVDVGVKVDESGAYTAATSTSGNYATWTVTLTNVTVGDHRLFARATDGASNKNWYDILVHVV